MKVQFAASLLASLLATTTNNVQAYPTGAGSCLGGQAAVGGAHLDADTVNTGSLEDGGLQVMINGSPITDMTTVNATETVDIELVSSDKGFKGFLIRLGAGEEEGEDQGVARQAEVDFTSVLMADDEDESVQEESTHCPDENAGGLTHTSNDVKTTVSGMFEIPQPVAGGVMMDVTVVMENGEVSEYYHTSYMLTVEGETTEEDGEDGTDMEDEEEEGPADTEDEASTAVSGTKLFAAGMLGVAGLLAVMG
jgi:hypothetical protein